MKHAAEEKARREGSFIDAKFAKQWHKAVAYWTVMRLEFGTYLCLWIQARTCTSTYLHTCAYGYMPIPSTPSSRHLDVTGGGGDATHSLGGSRHTP